MQNKQNNGLVDQFVNLEIRHQQLQQLWQPLLRPYQLRQLRPHQINPDNSKQQAQQRCRHKPVTQRPRKRKTAKKSQFQIVRT